MTREQTQALAALIARGAGHALDIGRAGDDWEGIAEAAQTYARTLGWSSPTETAGMRQAAHEHLRCRVELQGLRVRTETLEIALAAIVGAASSDGLSSQQSNLEHTIEAAAVLLGEMTRP